LVPTMRPPARSFQPPGWIAPERPETGLRRGLPPPRGG
jgi:hypothetical protein